MQELDVEMPPEPRRSRAWLGLIAFHAFSAVGMAGVMASAPDPSGEVALVYSPFSTPAEAFAGAAATDGRIVRVGRAPWIVVVAPKPQDKDFAARARAYGALLLLNPLVAGGCAAQRSTLSLKPKSS